MNLTELKYISFEIFLERDLQSEKFISLIEFKIPDYVIERFVKDYNIDKSKLNSIIRNFKLYFALFTFPQSKIYAMPNKIKEIDDLWHTYLIYTREYNYFCNKLFDRFIHHVPDNSVKNFNEERVNETMKNTYIGLKTLEEKFSNIYSFDYLEMF